MLSLKSAFVATAASVPWGMAAPVSTAASSAVRAIIASRAGRQRQVIGMFDLSLRWIWGFRLSGER